MKLKTLTKRVQTRTSGVFYKEIISDNNKVVDKFYGLRYQDLDGKERLKMIGKYSEGIREQYCKQKRNEIVTKIRLGEELPHIARSKNCPTFDEASKRYFDDKYLTKDNKKEQKRYENHIKKKLGDKQLINITVEDIELLQRNFVKCFAPRTVNHLIFMIATIYKHAIKKQIYKGTNPAQAIDNLKVDNTRERFLNNIEIKALLESSKAYLDVWLFVKLSLSTGGRISTIMNIKKKDIQLENNAIILYDQKNNQTYKGFFNDEIKSILQKQIQSLKLNQPIIQIHRRTIELRPLNK